MNFALARKVAAASLTHIRILGRRVPDVVFALTLSTTAYGLDATGAAPSGVAAAMGKLFPEATVRGIPGCVIDVRNHGKSVFASAYGLANLELPSPIGPDTIFEAGSVTKQFVGAALAALAVDGKISLDDDIRKFLPEMPDYGATITVRHLLNNTSGIRDWHDLTEVQGWGEGVRAHTQDFALRLITAQQGLNFVPGTEYVYSNSNFLLGVIIVERVTGQSMEAFTRQRFLQRLGMTRTSWRTDYARLVPGRAQAYAQDERGDWQLDMPFESTVGGGGLLTTVGDLQSWATMLIAPGPEDAAWVALLKTPGILTNGRATTYGLGIELPTIKGNPALSHAGWTAGYKAYLGVIPAQGLAAAILCNTSAINTENVGPEVLALFAERTLPTPSGASPATAPAHAHDPALTARAIGRYRVATTAAVVEVAAKDGGLTFNGGEAFTGGTDGLFLNASQSRSANVALTKSGGIETIRLTRVTNADLFLIPIAALSEQDATIGHYRGTYRNEETGASFTVTAQGDQLIFSGANSLAWSMGRLYADTFQAAGWSAWTAVFKRSGDKVAAFSLNRTRTRNLVFTRVN